MILIFTQSSCLIFLFSYFVYDRHNFKRLIIYQSGNTMNISNHKTITQGIISLFLSVKFLPVRSLFLSFFYKFNLMANNL